MSREGIALLATEIHEKYCSRAEMACRAGQGGTQHTPCRSCIAGGGVSYTRRITTNLHGALTSKAAYPLQRSF